jgi:hypothetical protein
MEEMDGGYRVLFPTEEFPSVNHSVVEAYRYKSYTPRKGLHSPKIQIKKREKEEKTRSEFVMKPLLE